MQRPPIILLLILLTYLSTFAQENSSVQVIGIDQGLSNNNVTKIYQDMEGFMWFGTYDGLNRYDAYNFKVFRNDPKNEASLPDNRITDINEDEHNRLWVGTRSGFAFYHKTKNSWNRINYKEIDSLGQKNQFAVNKLICDKNSTYAATDQMGLIRVNWDLNGPKSLENISILLNGKKLKKFTVRAMCKDSNQNIWFVINNVGLCLLNKKKNEAELISAKIKFANSMTISTEGSLWVISDEAVNRYDRKTKDFITILKRKNIGDFKIVNALAVEKRIWVNTDGGGIFIIDTEKTQVTPLTPPNKRDILNSRSIFASYKDVSGRIWIGTLRGGINVIDPLNGRFKLYRNEKTSMSSQNYVISLSEGKNGNVWIGTDGAGLFKKSLDNIEYKHYYKKSAGSTVSSDYITYIVTDKSDNVWLGTYNTGINKFDPKSEVFKRYELKNPITGKSDNFVWRLFIDNSERIWASTIDGGGLYIFNSIQDKFEYVDNNVRDVISIYQENNNVFWFGGYSSITRYNISDKTTKIFKIKHPARFIRKSYNEKIWIGTEGGGLLCLDPIKQKFSQYTEKDGLPSNTLLNVLEDDMGFFWISTYNGICRFDVKNISFLNYQKADGLQSNQFSYNAALKLKTGEFLFGGIKGFNLFNPKDLYKGDLGFPTIAFTDITIQNESYFSYLENSTKSLEDKIIVPYDKSTLSFSFAALDFSFAEKIKYAYFLDGWDNEWHYIENQRQAHYSHLREGTYNLRIKSTNADGKWSKDEKHLLITILPPWYRTWWAYLLYTSLAFTVFYLYIYYIKRQEKLKYIVKDKEQEILRERETHEKKIAFFTHIAHEFRTPLTLIVNPAKEMLKMHSINSPESVQLRHLYNNSKRLLTLVDKILLFRKSEHEINKLAISQINLKQLCKDVFLCFEQHAKSKQIYYDFLSDENDIVISGDKEKLEICLFNIIGNAFKFTPEKGYINIQLNSNKHQAFILVSDSGPGISKDLDGKIFDLFSQGHFNKTKSKEGFGIGLFLTKQLILAHHGELSYKNIPSGGVTFTINLPLSNELLKSNSQSHLSSNVTNSDKIIFNEDDTYEVNNNLISDIETIQLNYKEREKLFFDKLDLLIVDDDKEIRQYIKSIFQSDFRIMEAENVHEALTIFKTSEPALVICDITLENSSGIELCSLIKQSESWSHIPVILLTGSTSDDAKLKGWESGADDYITKPFDIEILSARVRNLIKGKNRLQLYFYNEITLQSNNIKISEDYKQFLQQAIQIVESHLTDPNFGVKMLVEEIGMSHSFVYKKIKAISGQSANEFIRYIKLRRVAKLLIDSDHTIGEAAFKAGFHDLKHFRIQFSKLFGRKPSEYRRKYRLLQKGHNITHQGNSLPL